MTNNMQLGKLERIALTDAYVTNSPYMKDLEGLHGLIYNIVEKKETAKKLFDDSESLFYNYNTVEILKKGWRIINEQLIPAFTKNGNVEGDNFNFEFLKEGEMSSIWKSCIVFMTLWKFAYSNRYDNKEDKQTTIEMFGKELNDYENQKIIIQKIVYFGTKWLDKIAEENNWQLPPVIPGDEEDGQYSMAIQEQSMYLFVRSHLSQQGKSEIGNTRIEPVKCLFDAKVKDTNFWHDKYSVNNNNQKEKLSVRASSMALIALSDILQNEYVSGSLAEEIRKTCKCAVIDVADAQNTDGSWPEFFYSGGDSAGNILATSCALSFLDRFSRFYELSLPIQIFMDSQTWLSKKITDITLSKEQLSIEKVEEVSRALPALARSCPYLSVTWYRKVFRSLFEKANMHYDKGFSTADAWRLYAVAEILRRPKIAKYLERLI